MVLNHVGEALSFTSWLRAVGLVTCGRAMPLEESGRIIRSEEGLWEINVPLVVMLRGGRYIRPQVKVRLSRKALFIRDQYTCMYCGFEGDAGNLTMDHVVPRSRGGVSTWENVVTACRGCNQKKGSRLLRDTGMQLRGRPARPHSLLSLHHRRGLPQDPAFEVWARYLPAQRHIH